MVGCEFPITKPISLTARLSYKRILRAKRLRQSHEIKRRFFRLASFDLMEEFEESTCCCGLDVNKKEQGLGCLSKSIFEKDHQAAFPASR